MLKRSMEDYLEEVQNVVPIIFLNDDGTKPDSDFLSSLVSLSARTKEVPEHWPDIRNLVMYGLSPREMVAVTNALHMWIAIQLSSGDRLSDGERLLHMVSPYIGHVYMAMDDPKDKQTLIAVYKGTRLYDEAQTPQDTDVEGL